MSVFILVAIYFSVVLVGYDLLLRAAYFPWRRLDEERAAAHAARVASHAQLIADIQAEKARLAHASTPLRLAHARAINEGVTTR